MRAVGDAEPSSLPSPVRGKIIFHETHPGAPILVPKVLGTAASDSYPSARGANLSALWMSENVFILCLVDVLADNAFWAGSNSAAEL